MKGSGKLEFSEGNLAAVVAVDNLTVKSIVISRNVDGRGVNQITIGPDDLGDLMELTDKLAAAGCVLKARAGWRPPTGSA